MKDRILLQIANGLSVNVQKLTNHGLLEGKMGVAIFLYHYALYSGRTAYWHSANRLMGEVLDSLFRQNTSFSTGLSGIGWGIKHLLKESFMKGEDSILKDLDDCLVRYVKEHTNEDMLDGCIYLACCRPELLDDTLALVLVERLSGFLSSGGHSLATLNKVLASAIHIPNQHLHPLYDRLPDAATRAIDTQLYRRSDIMICKDLLEVFNGKKENKSWEVLHARCMSILLTTGDLLTDHIETIWQYMVYLNTTHKGICDPGRVSTTVTNILKDLHIEDMYLSSGLPAMGMGILR